MTKFIKKCPQCGREWSTSFNTCQKCPGVVLDCLDLKGNIIADKKEAPTYATTSQAGIP